MTRKSWRIKAAAEKIKKTCDILVVIGIGGSYLGARAAIEFVKSPNYNALKKDTPEIWFAGNNICSSALSELLQVCEGKDICVNVISKSGTTASRLSLSGIFRELLEKKYGEEGARRGASSLPPTRLKELSRSSRPTRATRHSSFRTTSEDAIPSHRCRSASDCRFRLRYRRYDEGRR